MRKTVCLAIMLLLSGFFTGNVCSAEELSDDNWYTGASNGVKGGSSCLISAWKDATYGARLITAALWAEDGCPAIRAMVERDVERAGFKLWEHGAGKQLARSYNSVLKPFAAKLVNCMDDAVARHKFGMTGEIPSFIPGEGYVMVSAYDFGFAREVALGCMLKLGWAPSQKFRKRASRSSE
jgi:hypothetical protein